MKLIYILSLSIAFLISSVSVPAQEKKQTEKPDKARIKAGFGLNVVQTKPEFPGGEDSLIAFLKKNIVYPKKAKHNAIKGRVYVGFVVSSEGKIKDARVLTSVNNELDAEALRVVQLIPDWKPGYAGESPVDVQYILSVDFVPPKKP